MPKVSVLMAARNSARFIGEAVRSIQNQTFSDFEFLILDDASTDNTLRFLRIFEHFDSRIKVFHNAHNAGLAQCLNILIEHSTGQYLARMDADDISMTDRFEKQVNYLDKHRDCVAVSSRYLFVDTAGRSLLHSSNALAHEQIDGLNIYGEGQMCHPSTMMRSDAVNRIGGYQNSHAEDLDLFLRLAEIGRLHNISDVLLHYRQHLHSFGHTKARLQRDDAIKAVNDARKRRNLPALHDARTPLKTITKSSVRRKWAWWALSEKNIGAARHHAAIALALNPFSLDAIKLGFCALRGR